MNGLGIYIHIPFCVKKCNYCDFLSFSASDEAREAYVQTLCGEIRLEAREYKSYQVQTVFFGGGTPSLLTVPQLTGILETLKENFHVAKTAEISMEINPGTVTAESLRGYRAAGINRLSIGLQSANDEEMKILGRIHTYDMFIQAYKEAVAAGFTNINVDVMSALPGQDRDSYKDTLKKILRLDPRPTHISAYSLIVGEGTLFYEWHEQGKLNLPKEEEEREMYELTGEMLEEAGYRRYEISNYALPGYECEHNKSYWVRKNYLGFGLGAASMVENKRFSNEGDMNQYMTRVNTGVSTEKNATLLTKEEQMEETMFLGLRLMDGVSKQRFLNSYGVSMESVYGDVIKKHVESGLLMDGESVKLTKRGIDVSNVVMADFLL